jgi:hypothetical protein
LKIWDVFRQAASIELIWAKIAWTVEKLLMVLFKLEIPIPGRNLGSFGEMNPLEVFGSVGTPKDTSSRETASFDVYRSSKSAEPFLLGEVTRNEQNKKN